MRRKWADLKIDSSIPFISIGGINAVIFITMLTAALNALWVAFSAGVAVKEWDIFTKYYGHRHYDPSVLFLNIRIGTALLLCAVGLSFRKVKGLLLSMAALTWVVGEYVCWYFDSRRRLREMGVDSFAQLQVPDINYVGVFWGATSWSMTVLVITAVLYVWEINALIKIFFNTRDKQSSK